MAEKQKKQGDSKCSETNLLKKLDWDVNDEQDPIWKSSALFGGPGQTAPVAPHLSAALVAGRCVSSEPKEMTQKLPVTLTVVLEITQVLNFVHCKKGIIIGLAFII